MDTDLSKYFDTPERERSHAVLIQSPHLSNWLYLGLFLIGGFPLLVFCVIVWRVAWYVIQSVRLGRPCCLFPDRKPFPWTDTFNSSEPRDWESKEQRQVAGFLADRLVSPALRRYVQPDTPLCLLSLPVVFVFFSFLYPSWGEVAKKYNLGMPEMDRIHRLLNESPYEKRTFRDLVSLILTLGQGEHGKERYEGCIFLFVPLVIYFAESAALFLTGGDVLHILPGNGELFFQYPWLGVVLFPLHAVWVMLMCAMAG